MPTDVYNIGAMQSILLTLPDGNHITIENVEVVLQVETENYRLDSGFGRGQSEIEVEVNRKDIATITTGSQEAVDELIRLIRKD